MKIFIDHPINPGPYGGANQFIKALQKELLKQDVLAPSAKDANAIIYNANPGSLPRIIKSLPKQQHLSPHKAFIVRLDGPISLIRGNSRRVDQITATLIHRWADGVIFQSEWSKRKNIKMYGVSAPNETVIHNAPDISIFYPAPTRPKHPKVRLIAASWSSNLRKGFDAYRYLDQKLDWSRYDMTFIGNSPVAFRNIKHIPPQTSEQLASLLRQHDIYITASTNDPCSNSLLEALACGLPAVARNSGGHPELIKKGSLLFSDNIDLLEKIDQLSGDIDRYRQTLPTLNITKTARQYVQFAEQTLRWVNTNPRKRRWLDPTVSLYLRSVLLFS